MKNYFYSFRGTGYNKDLYIFIDRYWYAFYIYGILRSNNVRARYFKNAPQNVLHYEKVVEE